ncbi:MAG: glutamate--tRNA ligase [Candidatus Eremiobacteraeota bacterium]|nr:glutamate--tRNA ligase [Candidatus Eremiobacteraeota bacterium]
MTSSVRVRFAPSPTGSLHVGGARTALFNYLFARRNNGTLVVRSEDTDAARSNPQFEAAILADLRWLGLDWDEGPDVGGSFGPYRQSERQDRYALAAARLIEIEAVYPCYCTPEELEAERTRQQSRGEAPKYSGKCRELTKEQRAANEAQGRKPVLRFAMPQRDMYVEDLVRGSVHFPPGAIGDFVILRSDKTPAYNFAVVVDDSDMAITHVIRADEHLPNTPRQVALFEALELPLPLFAHVSMILAPDHQKLSKRHGATSVNEYRDAGFLPEALVNYLALLGWSPGDDREFFRLDELVKAFSLERASKSPAVFDSTKLRWFNAHEIRSLPRAARAALFAEWATRDPRYAALPEMRDTIWLETLADALSDHVEVLSDVPRELETLLADRVSLDASAQLAIAEPPVPLMLTDLYELAGEDHDRDHFAAVASKEGLKKLGDAHGLKGRSLFRPIRLAVTGSEHGIELPLLLQLLGSQRVRERIVSSLTQAVPKGQEGPRPA